MAKGNASKKEKSAAVSKAEGAAKAALTSSKKKAIKVRTSARFFRPHTFKLRKNPQYPSRAIPKLQKMDRFAILKAPLATETAMKKVEQFNTLVFLVHPMANKRQIKLAMKEAYDVKCEKVNTLIRPDGQKKAFIKLSADSDALDVANRIGLV